MIPPIEIHGHFSISEKKEMQKQCDFLEEWYKYRAGISIPRVDVMKTRLLGVEGICAEGVIYIARRSYTPTTFIHELNHDYQYIMNDSLYTNGIEKLIDSIAVNEDSYWTDPMEVHSRLMELRYLNDLKPTDVITDESFDDIIIPMGYSLNMYSKEELIYLLNSVI